MRKNRHPCESDPHLNLIISIFSGPISTATPSCPICSAQSESCCKLLFLHAANSNSNLQLTNIVEEEERQGSRSSQDKDTVEEEEEASIESGVSKLNLVKKIQPKIDPIEKGTPKKNPTEPGEKPMDPSEPGEPIGETGSGLLSDENINKQNEDKTDVNQPGEEPRSETQREEEETSGTTATKRKVSRT